MEKSIGRKEIRKNVKKEFKEVRDWCRQRYGRYGVLMIDVDDARIWSDLFIAENSWKTYSSDTVKRLYCDYGCTVSEQESSYVDYAVKLLTNAGWNIMD